MLPSDVFKRDGVNILVDVPLSMRQAVLGGTVQVPTLDGIAELIVRRSRTGAPGGMDPANAVGHSLENDPWRA